MIIEKMIVYFPLKNARIRSSFQKSEACDKINELQSQLQTLRLEKEKAEVEHQETLTQKQQVVIELNEKLDACAKEKEKSSSDVVSVTFKWLVDKVKSLRVHRENAPNVDDLYPSTQLKSIVDLYIPYENNTTSSICLSTIKPYQSLQIEQDALLIQKDLLAKYSDNNDAESLEELIEEKDEIVRKCAKHVKRFLTQVSALPLEEREQQLMSSLEFLKSNYPLDDISASLPEEWTTNLEKIVLNYKTDKKARLADLQKFREISNNRSSQLFKTIGQLQRECHCVVSANPSPTMMDNVDELVKDYHTAMDEEIAESLVCTIS